MDKQKLTMFAGIGGAVAAVGVILPWASISVGPFGSSSVSGFQVDLGWLVFIGGVAGVATFGLDALGKGSVIPLAAKQKVLIGLIGLCLASVIVLIRFFDIPGAMRGFGLWLSLLGSLGGAVCAFLLFKPEGLGGGAPGGGSDGGGDAGGGSSGGGDAGASAGE
jgi:hypothetical protein